MPTQELQTGYHIEPTSSDFHIPLLFCRSFRGKPYFLNITFFSENLPEDKIVLTKVFFKNTRGKTFNLLDEPFEIESFGQERFAASSSQYGTYNNMIYKDEWRSQELPLLFQKASHVSLR